MKDFSAVMRPWRVKDLGLVSYRGVPKTLMIDDTGTMYFSTYIKFRRGWIFRLTYGDEKPVFTGAFIPTQKGMDDHPVRGDLRRQQREHPHGGEPSEFLNLGVWEIGKGDSQAEEVI